ncbi:MAG: hypothetical protein RL653_2165 [Pseudomonadota bacterium]
MDVVSVRALRGPNIWTRRTVLEVKVQLVDGAPLPSPAALAQLQSHLPQLALPAQNLRSGPLALPHLFERTVLALQQQAGVAATFGRTAPSDDPGLYEVVVEYVEEEVGRRAVEMARELLSSVLGGKGVDVPATVKALRSLDENIRLGPTTGSIVKAAQRRGIPIRRLNTGSLVQFGWGVRQRRILAAETDTTGAIAESIAQDKELTKQLLRSVGVPVPDGRNVSDAEDAWVAATDIGLPVVVKPRYGNQGRGVAVNLKTRDQVIAAYASSREEGSSVMVERCAPGVDYRLLVIGNKLVAAARRDPPLVMGDGRRSIRELVEEVNKDPRRGEDHATSLSKIPLDAIALAVLAEQGLTAESVPAPGARVVLRRNANLSTGGSATDVTDEVHPDVAARAVDAARVIGLDICGVDVVCEDIRRPLEEQGGVMVEVNAAPGFRMHLDPSYGLPRPVGDAVVSTLYPPDSNGRVPVVAVTGNNGKTTTVRLIAAMFRALGRTVGMTCTDGIYVNGRRVDTGDCSGPKSARSVLANPMVEAAVLETARGGVLREGLGFDQCDVAVVTNIGEGDHLGMNGIHTPSQLAAVKRVIVENVGAAGTAVLNAADPLTVAMAPACPGSVTMFALSRTVPALAAHRERGGRVVFLEGSDIITADGHGEQRFMSVLEIPVTRGGKVLFQVENCLAAVAAAMGAGIPFEAMRKALVDFESDFRRAPGRFNVVEHQGATLVVDYGHNPDALNALVSAIERLPHERRVIVLTAAGDRRDADLLRLGEIVGNHFDEVVLFEDACNRGRADGEVTRLLRQGMSTGRRVQKVEEFRGELVALEATLQRLQPGDMGLLMVDEVERSLNWLEKRITRATA